MVSGLSCAFRISLSCCTMLALCSLSASGQAKRRNLTLLTAFCKASYSSGSKAPCLSAKCALRARRAKCECKRTTSARIFLSDNSIYQRAAAAARELPAASTSLTPQLYSVVNMSALATRSAMAAFSRARAARRDWFLFVSRTTTRATKPPITAESNEPIDPLHNMSVSNAAPLSVALGLGLGVSIPKIIPEAYRSDP